ncbi:hypothetical protein HY490_05965 [Candidatus Woesearchaeota archaeon]|nr:hypothetical protein [Candidatus Woesearchaeota archaeon]
MTSQFNELYNAVQTVKKQLATYAALMREKSTGYDVAREALRTLVTITAANNALEAARSQLPKQRAKGIANCLEEMRKLLSREKVSDVQWHLLALKTSMETIIAQMRSF